MGTRRVCSDLLLIAGVLNIIYGIGAISDGTSRRRHSLVFGSLHAWGWINGAARIF